MAWSKFDPQAPVAEDIPEAAARRVWLLRYGWWITLAFTALGYAIIAWVLL